MLCFHFHAVQNILKFPWWYLLWPMDYLEICLISKSWVFPRFLLLVSNLSPLWSENVVCMTWIILNLLTSCFMFWNMFYSGECSTCTLKECLFSSPWSEFYRSQLGQVGWYHCSSFLYSCWFSIWLFYSLLRVRY